MRNWIVVPFHFYNEYGYADGWLEKYIELALQDFIELGVTHIMVYEPSGEAPILLLKKIKEAGLSAVANWGNMAYTDGESTGSKRWRTPIATRALEELGLLEVIDAHMPDDVRSDVSGDPELMRDITFTPPGHKLPWILSVAESQTSGYAATMQTPYPRGLLYQAYARHTADSLTGRWPTEAETEAAWQEYIQTALIARRDYGVRIGVWLQTFGYTGSTDPLPLRDGTRWYRIFPTAAQLTVWVDDLIENDFDGPIGMFTMLHSGLDAADPYGGLYKQNDLTTEKRWWSCRREPQWSALQAAFTKWKMRD